LSPFGLLRARSRAALSTCEVGQHQLGVDGRDVAERVDRAVDVHHVGHLEAAHHLQDRVDLADVAEELVAEALALVLAPFTRPAMSTIRTMAG
jgi:hypothetical protein